MAKAPAAIGRDHVSFLLTENEITDHSYALNSKITGKTAPRVGFEPTIPEGEQV
jgi:hypothetical protein